MKKDLSVIQIIALCIVTTILTDKFLINHQPNSPQNTPNQQAGVSTSPVPTQPASNSQNEIILRELINLRKDMTSTLNDLKKTQTTTGSASIPTLSASLLGGMVKISSPQYKTLDVFESPQASSKIVNTLTYDTIYFYRQKQGDWYQIDFDTGQLGWVQAQYLKEFP